MVEAVLAVITFENGTPKREVIYFSDLERYRLFFETLQDKSLAVQEVTTLNKKDQLTRRRDAVIHQKLFEREAQRFAIKKPTEPEVAEALTRIRQRFQDEADFARALNQGGLRLSSLKEEIVQYLWVEKLIRERIQEFIFIGPKAIETYQLNHLDAFIGQGIETIEKKITQILSREKEIEKKKSYLKRLKEKVQIEFIFNPDGGVSGDP